jgi:hypothetical protein
MIEPSPDARRFHPQSQVRDFAGNDDRLRRLRGFAGAASLAGAAFAAAGSAGGAARVAGDVNGTSSAPTIKISAN